MADHDEPDGTQPGVGLRRWLPLLAAPGGIAAGVSVGLVSDSWLAGGVVAVVLSSVMVSGFYLPERSGPTEPPPVAGGY